MHKRKIKNIYMTLGNKIRQMRCHYIKKNCRHNIPEIIIDNIMCSLFIDNHGGMLLLMTKMGHAV